MKKKDEKTYTIDLNAKDFADIFTGILIDYTARVVNDFDTKQILQNALKLLVVYSLETGKVTGKDFSKLGAEMIALAENPDKIRAGKSTDERYQALIEDVEAFALEQED